MRCGRPPVANSCVATFGPPERLSRVLAFPGRNHRAIGGVHRLIVLFQIVDDRGTLIAADQGVGLPAGDIGLCRRVH